MISMAVSGPHKGLFMRGCPHCVFYGQRAVSCLAVVQCSKWWAFQNRALPRLRLRTKKKTLDFMGFFFWGGRGPFFLYIWHLMENFLVLPLPGAFIGGPDWQAYAGGGEILVHPLWFIKTIVRNSPPTLLTVRVGWELVIVADLRKTNMSLDLGPVTIAWHKSFWVPN